LLAERDNALHDKDIHSEGARLVALVADLMFAARVRGAAPDAAVARSLAALLQAAGPETGLVLVDLQARDSVEAIERVREAAPSAQVIAFGPHVEKDALAAAQSAGADRVMARGAFVRELAEIVAPYAGDHPGER
jgi:DNA-binding NarL/FixJ family response regulator